MANLYVLNIVDILCLVLDNNENCILLFLFVEMDLL